MSAHQDLPADVPSTPNGPLYFQALWVFYYILGGFAALAIIPVCIFAPKQEWYYYVIAAIVATIILRQRAPSAGRIASKALNILLLPFIPFGTAVGIYGLLKVDKE